MPSTESLPPASRPGSRRTGSPQYGSTRGTSPAVAGGKYKMVECGSPWHSGPRLLLTPLSRGRVAAPYPNTGGFQVLLRVSPSPPIVPPGVSRMVAQPIRTTRTCHHPPSSRLSRDVSVVPPQPCHGGPNTGGFRPLLQSSTRLTARADGGRAVPETWSRGRMGNHVAVPHTPLEPEDSRAPPSQSRVGKVLRVESH